MIEWAKAVVWFAIRMAKRCRLIMKGSVVAGYFHKCEFGTKTTTHRTSNLLRSCIGDWGRIRKNVIINDSVLGDYCVIQQGTMVSHARIGSFCGIADYSTIGAEYHPTNRVTAHVIMSWPSLGMVDKVDEVLLERRRLHVTTIGNDVWIGHGAIVLPGVTIGDGAVIGAGSVVMDHVDSYTVVAGNPARVIRMRFKGEIVEGLKRIQWWRWPRELIKQRIKDFINPELFFEKYDPGMFAIDTVQGATTGQGKAPTQAEMKVLVAATFMAEPIIPMLEFWCQLWQWPIVVESAEYNQLFQQLLDPTKAFRSNTDGYNICLIRFDDWLGLVDRSEADADCRTAITMLVKNAEQFLDSISTAILGAHANYIIIICPPSPGVRLSREIYQSILSVKKNLEKRLGDHRDVIVISWEQIEYWYPVTDWYQGEGEELGHIPYTDRYFIAMASALARVIACNRRSPYKAVVADCDGTLWAGVLGEDGIPGIKIDEGYSAIQRQLLDIRSRGMLLCICSKNDKQEVMNALRHHPDMLLKPEHFTIQCVNWQPKSQNIRQIAQGLNIGLDSIIFIDDNPVECAEVQANLPDVFTICLPQDSSIAARALRHTWAFDLPPGTREDSERAEMYQRDTQREKLKKRSLSFAKFVADLNLVVKIVSASTEQIPRISQLTIRTNQFNATGIRLAESQVGDLLRDPSISCFVVQVADRFGDYGLVGVMIARQADRTLIVQNIMLSCRALGRGVEHRMLSQLGLFALSRGLEMLECRCAKTEKNEPIRSFLLQVCSVYGVDYETEILFRVPSVFAASIEFKPDDATQSMQTPKIRKNEAGMKRNSIGVGDKRALMLRIMNEMNDVVAIEAAVKAFRMSGTHWRRSETTSYEPANVTATEKKLMEIWKDVLAVPSVDIHESFFDAGGTSIQMPSVAFQIMRALNVKISLVDLFQLVTIERLASFIDSKNSSMEPD